MIFGRSINIQEENKDASETLAVFLGGTMHSLYHYNTHAPHTRGGGTQRWSTKHSLSQVMSHFFFISFTLSFSFFTTSLSSFLFHVPWAERVVVSEQPMNQYTTYYTLPVPNSTSTRSPRYPALHRIRSSGHDLDIFGRTVCRCSIPKQMSKFLLHFIVICPFPPPTRSL